MDWKVFFFLDQWTRGFIAAHHRKSTRGIIQVHVNEWMGFTRINSQLYVHASHHEWTQMRAKGKLHVKLLACAHSAFKSAKATCSWVSKTLSVPCVILILKENTHTLGRTI